MPLTDAEKQRWNLLKKRYNTNPLFLKRVDEILQTIDYKNGDIREDVTGAY